MLNTLTHLSAKDVQFIQPHRSLKWCEAQLRSAKEALRARVVLVKHLAEFWCVEEDDIITSLRGRFAL